MSFIAVKFSKIKYVQQLSVVAAIYLTAIIINSCGLKENESAAFIPMIVDSVKIESIIDITGPDAGVFRQPRFSEDGSALFFLDEGDNIWCYDFERSILEQLTHLKRSPGHYLISDNGSAVMFSVLAKGSKERKIRHTIMKFDRITKQNEFIFSSENSIEFFYLFNDFVFALANEKFEWGLKVKQFEKSSEYFVYKNQLLEISIDQNMLNHNELGVINSIDYCKKNNSYLLSRSGQTLYVDSDLKQIKLFEGMFNSKWMAGGNAVVNCVNDNILVYPINSDKRFNVKINEPFIISEFDTNPEKNIIAFITSEGQVKLISLKVWKSVNRSGS